LRRRRSPGEFHRAVRPRAGAAKAGLAGLLDRSEVRWIALGVVIGTHGLRGLVRVKVYNPESGLLPNAPEIMLRREGTARAHSVLEAQFTPKGLLLLLSGVSSVEAAAELRGAELCLPRQLLPALPDGEYYHVDLEGLPAFNPAGERVGTVERVQEYPAAHVLRVRVQAQKGVWEVPMREPYLVEIDLEGGRVVVDAVEDLELERDREPR